MPFSVDDLTVDDFLNSGWRTAVEGAEERGCLHYRSAFRERADEAREAGKAKQANLFALFGDLASMFLDADDPADPIKPMWQGGGHRSAIPSDFDPALPLLADILPHVDDPDLKARIADVLWIRKRDYKAAREAAAAYLASARLADGEAWPDATDRVERAIEIAARTGQRDLIDDVLRHVEAALDGFGGGEDSFLPARLMQILQNRKAGDAARYATLAESLARASEGRGDWHKAREYWDRQAVWYKIADDGEQEMAARLRSAESYVQEADSRMGLPHGEGYMVAAHFIERAIHALRGIDGQRERITELHHRLLELQRNAVAGMKSVSHEFDASEMIAHATEAVAGKTLEESLLAFALLGHPPRIESLRKQARWERQNSILALMPMTFTNALGRTVARRDPPDLGETEGEADLRIGMYKTANLSRVLHVQGYILPARAQILREHTVRIEEMMSLVRDNPFVPQGREEFFARGLQAGFGGDFVAAAHLLIPQIENSVRYVLEQHGVLVSGLNHDGIQDEENLNGTLRNTPKNNYADRLTEIIGEDLVFDLRGLLIEKYGANLRNDLAHGLLDYDALNSFPSVYLWWLTLRLCCLPVILARYREQTDAEGGDEAPSAVTGGDTDGESE